MRQAWFATAALFVLLAGPIVLTGQQPESGWKRTFTVTPADLATEGDNPYFVLRPGLSHVLEGKEEGASVRLVVSVLAQTERVGGFDTRIVEERETRNGALVEVSRNFMAIDTRTRDLYYFGEDVDIYKGGKVVSHEGAWRHGSGGASFGLMLPGTPAVGLRYYQELAPRIAMDRAEVVSLSERVTVPAGTFDACLKTEETTPLEPGTREYKVYAPGVGLVMDGTLALVSRSPAASR